MQDHKTMLERANKLFRRMERVLDDYEEELERLEREDEATEEYLDDMIAAEHYISQFEALCEIDPVSFVEAYAFIADMSNEEIFHKVLVTGKGVL